MALWRYPKMSHGSQAFLFLHELVAMSSCLERVITLGETVLCGLGQVPVREKAKICQYLLFLAVSVLTLENRMGEERRNPGQQALDPTGSSRCRHVGNNLLQDSF